MQQINTDSTVPAFLWDYSISFITDQPGLRDHYHHCYKVVISLDKSFKFSIDGQTFSGVRGYITNQDVPHSYSAPDLNILVSLIEVNSVWGLKLRTLLGDKSWVNMNTILKPAQYARVLPVNYKELSNAVLIPYVNNFLDSFFSMMPPSHTIHTDDRMQRVLQFIDKNLHNSLELEDLQPHINLSTERIRHLFVQQMHISFSQYVLWKRIRKTMQMAIAGESKLTEACYRFGFSDQAHFNKAFKRIFGVTPFGIIRYCRVLL